MISLKTSLGVGIRHDSITLCLLNKTLKGVKIYRYRKVEVEGSVEKMLGFEVKRFLADEAVNPDWVSISLPRDVLAVRFLKFPSTVRDDINNAIRYELDRHFPLPPSEAVFTYYIMEGTEKDFIEAAVFVVKKDIFTGYLQALESEGIKVDNIEPSSLSRLRFINPEDLAGRDVFIADIYENHAELDLVSKSTIVFMQSASCGENSIVDSLADMAQNAVYLLPSHITFNDISHVLVNNSRGSMDETLNLISQRMEMAAKGLPVRPDIDISLMDDKDIPFYVTSIGTALTGVSDEDKDCPVNFVPAGMRPKRRVYSLYSLLILAAITLSFVLAGVSGRFYMMNKKEIELEKQDSALKKQAAELFSLEEKSRALTKSIACMHDVEGMAINYLAILENITRNLPKDAWIQELKINGNEVVMQCRADSILNVQKIFQGSRYFDSVNPEGSITDIENNKQQARLRMIIGKRDEKEK